MGVGHEFSAAIDGFAGQADVLHRLVAGLSPAELDAAPVPGKWSLRTLAIHVMDSDQFCIGRMKRIIAEDLPLLIAYDETAFASRLFYPKQDLAAVCELFRLGRVHTGQILRELPPEAFARAGIHNQNGRMTLGDLVERYVQHVEHHLVFAREKLRAMGKPVAV